jgi:FKBP-type peptidyl-prolyl cis-trans isomerase FkpA
MKYLSIKFIIGVLMLPLFVLAERKSDLFYQADTTKPVSFYATFLPGEKAKSKTWQTGIAVSGGIKLYIAKQKKASGIYFSYPSGAKILSRGLQVATLKDGGLMYNEPLLEDKEYSLMLSTAADVKDNFTIYSAYVFLPEVHKWKLIGTCKLPGYKAGLDMPGVYYSFSARDTSSPVIKNEWAQRPNGKWDSQNPANVTPPVINLLGHVDSAAQIGVEIAEIEYALKIGKTDAAKQFNGVYYTIMKEGAGKVIQLTDTVRIFYKGYLFSDGSVFDQTNDGPRSFPLNRLIMGWQIGVPLIKTGGKIKLVIPSHLGYSIRTRSPKIPPNSTLVFEIEVVSAVGK